MRKLQKIILTLFVVFTAILLSVSSFASEDGIVLEKDNILKYCEFVDFMGWSGHQEYVVQEKGLLDCDFQGIKKIKQINFEGIKLERLKINGLDKVWKDPIFNDSGKEIGYYDFVPNYNFFIGLEDIIYLDFYGDITKLGTGLLHGLSELKHLNLHLGIYYIYDEAFSSLKKLEKLNLSENEIHSINKFTFKGLDNLRSLDLGFTNLNSICSSYILGMNYGIEKCGIEEGSFDDMILLEEISFFNSNTDFINKNIFKKNKKLKEIILSENQSLDSIDMLSFNGLDELERVYFANLKLKSPDVLDFSKFHNIKDIQCPNNYIKKGNTVCYKEGISQKLNKNDVLIINLITNKLKIIFSEKGPVYKGIVLSLLKKSSDKNKYTNPELSFLLKEIINNFD